MCADAVALKIILLITNQPFMLGPFLLVSSSDDREENFISSCNIFSSVLCVFAKKDDNQNENKEKILVQILLSSFYWNNFYINQNFSASVLWTFVARPSFAVCEAVSCIHNRIPNNIPGLCTLDVGSSSLCFQVAATVAASPYYQRCPGAVY